MTVLIFISFSSLLIKPTRIDTMLSGATILSLCYLHKSGSQIPPTAVGGWLTSSLHDANSLLNPPNGSWGMVKVQPPAPVISHTSQARRLDFNHPPIAIVGIVRNWHRYVGWTLTIPRLPSGGLRDPELIDDNDLKSWRQYQSCVVRFSARFCIPCRASLRRRRASGR